MPVDFSHRYSGLKDIKARASLEEKLLYVVRSSPRGLGGVTLERIIMQVRALTEPDAGNTAVAMTVDRLVVEGLLRHVGSSPAYPDLLSRYVTAQNVRRSLDAMFGRPPPRVGRVVAGDDVSIVTRRDGVTQAYHTSVVLREPVETEADYIAELLNRYGNLAGFVDPRSLLPNEGGRGGHYLIVKDGEKVGTVGYWSSGYQTVFLRHLVVEPQHRGQGIGTRAVERFLGWARNNGYGKVALTVNTANKDAVRLYERLGFTREGTLKSHYGAGRDIHVYAYHIQQQQRQQQQSSGSGGGKHRGREARSMGYLFKGVEGYTYKERRVSRR